MKSLLTSLLVWFAALLFAQSPDNLIPRELLFREKDKINVRLSLDGETIYYQKKADGADSTLYYVSGNFAMAENKRRFNGTLMNWIPLYNNGLAVVLRQGEEVFAFNTTQNSSVNRKLKLFPLKKMDFLHISRVFPNKVAVNIEAQDSTQSGIYILDLISSSLKRLGMMGDFQSVYFDDRFGMVAAMKPNDQGGNTILRRHDGEWIEVFKYPSAPDMFIGGLTKIISASLDGKTIYATDYTNKDKTTLVSIDVKTGQVTEMVSDPDADILPFGATVNLDGKPTSVVALWGDSKRHFLEPAVEKDFSFLNNELKTNIGFAGASQNDSTWLVRTLDGGPQTYYLYNRSGRKLAKLFNDYPYLDGYDLATRKAYTVTTRDGIRLPVHVYVPPGMSKVDGSPKTPLPTIIYVHGGPWAGVTHWNSWFHNRNFQLLANRGYVVINMEFRGTTGLGKKVTEAGNLQWGEAMHYDIVDVASWAIKAGIANRNKVGIWGWSYGGYAANYALGAAPDLFSCGISMYGISDLYRFCQLPFADNDTWRTRVGDFNMAEGAALLRQHSPTNYLKNIKSPILLTTGSLDDRIPQDTQVDSFAKALDEAGKEVIYFFYPKEGHDFEQPESWISFWAVAEYFLHQNLGGRKEARKEDIENGNLEIMFGADYIEEID
jgi:acetyl esterase/lipase